MKEKEMNGSMETVFSCVIPYIQDGDDRNSISLVSPKLYELDSFTRKHVTVHAHYAPNPSRVSQRFPFIESLTLKGLPRWYSPEISDIDITPWIEEISVKFECLKALHIHGMVVCDSDLKLLAKTRGKDIRSLKICSCEGFSTDGLMHVSKYCNDLRTLCYKGNYIANAYEKDGQWLSELALHNKVIESLHFDFDINDVNDLTLIAKKCSNSLVSLKFCPLYLSDLGDVLSHAIKLQDFHGIAMFDEDGDYSSFEFPPSIRGVCIENLLETEFSLLLPYVNQLRELNLICKGIRYCQCFLIGRCPNLEVLYTDDACRGKGLQVIGQVCKKLRKFTHHDPVTHMELIALVQGCINLEYLDVKLFDISNEAIECIGSHLKNLCDIRIRLIQKRQVTKTNLPLDNGIRAMLMGCIKLKRLALSLCDGGLTDVGLGYIGKYGHNLRYLSLDSIGESDTGLVELSKGCPKLRKLVIKDCPFSKQAIATFVFNIHSLRYIWVESNYYTVLALTRPTEHAEVQEQYGEM